METKSKTVWDAFGQYVSRSMKNGRGVWVPKFGIFTFSAMDVDLAVSYFQIFFLKSFYTGVN